jgi:hypothetical protein
VTKENSGAAEYYKTGPKCVSKYLPDGRKKEEKELNEN